VNDVLVAALAGALRRYLEGRSAAVEGLEVNAVCPVNLRPLHEAEQLGNRFGLIWLALPIGSADPLERLRLVKERMDALKRSPEPLVVFGILSALGVAPAEVSGPLVDLFGAKGTAVLTNVAGPRQAIYIAGGRIEDIMFWVPQSGRLGLGLSILSYDGRVRVGVASDRGLVPDPEAIADAFEAEFAALAEAARQATRPVEVPAPAAPRRAPARPRKVAGPRKATSRPRAAAADRTGKRRKRA
jgi:WS/DGAT/MGAT family acyltransferase